ncbi:MAG: phosphoribosylaminoimidazolesuccinocarboxamide synthase [candidate division Zixibacteria bacterium]|nr:phosphoribosylaminoimidazolesuccinocarboxamide synthase [candidate division Zixibacteria bacterium]
MTDKDALLTTNFKGLKLFRSGKVRDIYDLGENLLFVATDRISAFDVIMKQGIPGKGEMLTKISAFWFDLLKDVIPNHMIAAYFNEFPENLKEFPNLKGRSMIVKKVERIDIECIVRGYITGSAWKEYKSLDSNAGVKVLYGNKIPDNLIESQEFPEPIFTPSTKADDGHDENISLGKFYEIIGEKRGDEIVNSSIMLYKRASEYARTRGIILADTKFEFGLDDDKLILIDEALTPDSSRFWNVENYVPGKSQDSYDKQYLRDYLKSVGWTGTPPPPDLPDEVINNTARKYREAYNSLIK